MLRLRFLIPLLALAAGSLPAAAADLSKIERKIAREPAYQGSPKYCLLVFGPEAGFRVWLVIDGDALYVDRDGSGNLTEPGKRVTRGGGTWFRAGDLIEPDGKTKHTELRVRSSRDTETIYVSAGGKRLSSAGRDPSDRLHFAGSAAKAPVIHFDGPLTMRFYDGPPELRPGTPCEVDVVVGTPGGGPGSFAMLHLCACGTGKPVVPVVTFEFPPPEPLGKPVTVRCRCADD